MPTEVKVRSAIAIRSVESNKDPQLDGGYWRIVARTPDSDQLIGAAPPVTAEFIKKAIGLLWQQNESLLITAKARLEGTGEMPLRQLFFADTGGTADAAQPSRIYLTPWLTDVEKAEVEFSVARGTNVHSAVVGTLLPLVATAASVLDAGALALAVRTPAAKAAAQQADAVAAKFLSSTQTKPVIVDVTPFSSAGKKGVSHKEFFVGDKPAPETTLFIVGHEFSETLLAGSGKRRDISTDSETILSRLLITTAGPQRLNQLLQSSNAVLVANLNRGTSDAIQAFCRGIQPELTNLGLAEIDRLVVIRAYLKATVWARKAEARPDLDDCASVLDEDRIVKAAPQLTPFPSPARTALAEWAAGDILRQKLIPAALQGDAAQRLSFWQQILADDQVTLVAVGNGVRLSEAFELKAKGSQGFIDKEEVAKLLSGAPLTWSKKEVDSCFEPISPKTSRLMMRAKSACIRYGTLGASVPMSVAFVLASTTKPQISEIQFWAD